MSQKATATPSKGEDIAAAKDDEEVRSTRSPASVLASTSLARTLTISDQHANILLTQNDSEKKALLKLTLVPFHKVDLACLPRSDDDDNGNLSEEEINAKKVLHEKEEKEHSSKVLTFLSSFQWRMTSESGAEYSYHEAAPKDNGISGVDDKDAKEPATKKLKTAETNAKPMPAAKASVFKAELIFPASERQLSRAMPSPGLHLVTESPVMYEAVTKPFIHGVVSSGSLSWIKNIVEIKKEKERLLWNADEWILNIDTKWRTHPDALTAPRSEWLNHESVVDLYCLGIFKAEGVDSLRDLTGEHLPLLREMLEQGPKVIEEVYGVPKDQLRIFVHYQPQFYHFHVHYTRLENDTGAQVERAHLLSDIIQDLEQDPECFQKKTLVYKLGLKDKLYQLLKAYEESKEEAESKK